MFIEAWAKYDKAEKYFSQPIRVSVISIASIRAHPYEGATIITTCGARTEFGNVYYLDMTVDAACRLVEDVYRSLHAPKN